MIRRITSLLIATICSLTMAGQLLIQQRFEELTNQARAYSQQKEYAKSNECYERLVSELRGSQIESLIPSLREMIALNHMNMGVSLIKAKDFDAAKPHLDAALKDAKEGSRVQLAIFSWTGNWYSGQSLDIRLNHGDFNDALAFSQEAVHYYALAQAQEKVYKEQLSIVGLLTNLSRMAEAESILTTLISECKDQEAYIFFKGRAYGQLGEIEQASERLDAAIYHLEQSYAICHKLAEGDHPSAKNYALIAARHLKKLFTDQIPDSEKADLWQKRIEKLEK